MSASSSIRSAHRRASVSSNGANTPRQRRTPDLRPTVIRYGSRPGKVQPPPRPGRATSGVT
jgi:hypothetical protein